MTDWIDVSNLSFNTIMLLEPYHFRFLASNHNPNNDSHNDDSFAIALYGNPAAEWYIKNKCPELKSWIDSVFERIKGKDFTAGEIRQAELNVLSSMTDWITYVVDPMRYDNQQFTKWDDSILTGVTDFSDKVVIDVGAGTGRLTFAVAQAAKCVYAVEPVWNLRETIKKKAERLKLQNIYTMDGLFESIPLMDDTADILVAGHVYDKDNETGIHEIFRVVKPGGMIILCPCSAHYSQKETESLEKLGFRHKTFIEPLDDLVGLYWTTVKKQVKND